MRVLGVDPGLTRCGLGIVENGAAQKLVMVGVGVIQTSADIELAQRLLELETQLLVWIKEFKPDVIAVERVFSQLNIRTAMSTGQAAGVALLIAARSGIPVAMHTPTEVKAAVTGSGRADKKQVALMVQKLLSLKEIPKPADSTDALALAICHHWRGSGNARIELAVAKEKARLAKVAKK
ncbi:MAG: crossover junction endodeoxyribonuclease RuvC [Actinobacteria bacterium]|nr:crossover junction endodeoxyribonuclease RuvC [Actinomycetota bacterium]MDA2981762.1 crossover junction endodeoxyribonuclease RuvC [Actinomycetota bacterium]MDA2996770.1 crossover junction endodeoxyribonuclease RuvC [Actinomycetota bacterium]